MNRINQLRNLALAIGLASLCGFGCSSPVGSSDGQTDDELQHSHLVRVDGTPGDNAESGYAAGTGPVTKTLVTNLGPSPEPWAENGDGNDQGPSPEPWHASVIPNDDDGSGGTGTAGGAGTGTGSSGSSGNTSSSSGGNPNPNASANNNK